MKYLVLFAIVVQALAAPPGKPAGNPGPGTGIPSGPSGHPFDHPNVTGSPPPPPDGSFDSRPHGNDPPAGDVVPGPKGDSPPLSENSPRPAKGNPPPNGKPPGNGQPPAGNARPKRHLNGERGKPTGAPHVENHTHDFTGSHPHIGTAGSHSGEKGHDSRPGKRH